MMVYSGPFLGVLIIRIIVYKGTRVHFGCLGVLAKEIRVYCGLFLAAHCLWKLTNRAK